MVRVRFRLLPLLLALAGVSHSARAFNHPGIPLTLDDLNYVKARLNVQPWLAGFNALKADPLASTNYVMRGPFPEVIRNQAGVGVRVNRFEFKDDMEAVYKMALMWYYTGNSNYGAKATAIFDAWATTMTNYGGTQAYLDLGDFAYTLFGGSEILRSTYPGWTAAHTQRATNYYYTAIKPALSSGVPIPVRGANQGMAQIKAAMGLAIWCDDTNYWNQCLYALRNDAAGLPDTAPLGMIGDTGRDQGHSEGQFNHYAWSAAVAWAQGVDIFSELDNRLATCAEYYSKYNQYNTVPYVTFGSTYGMYATIGSDSRGRDLPFRTIIETAYVARKGMNLPWTARMAAVYGAGVGFEFYRQSDSSTATYAPLTPFATPAAFTNWTKVQIGSPANAGSCGLTNGVWTVRGGGANVNYSGSDQFHFSYVALTNDFVMVARVLSITNGGAIAKAGLMVRESLSSTANFANVHLMPGAIEAQVRGAIGGTAPIITFTQTLPYWIKVERRSGWIGRYASPDGINWQPMNYAWTTMSNTVYVGLMACAGDNSKLMTATMDNVAIGTTTGVGGLPPPPTELTATAGQSQTMLSWVVGAGTTYCNVKRASSSGGPYTLIAGNVPASTYIDMDVTNGVTYYYAVSGTNSAGEGSNSVYASATPTAAAAVPPAPTGLSVFAFDSSATVSWTPVAGATSYNVKRSTSPGGPFVRTFYGTDRDTPDGVTADYTDMDVTNGVTYYYVVNAVNYYGESTNQAVAVSAMPQAAQIWTGLNGSTWNVGSTTNWTTNGIATVYQNGKPAQFDDTAITTTVNNTATVTPSAVLINNALNNYTFTASGTSIGGTASVFKRGTGTVNWNAANTYSGGTTIFGGQINMGSGTAMGTGPITLEAGSYDGSANLYVAVNSTVTWSQDVIVAGHATNVIQIQKNTGTKLNLAGKLIGGSASTLELSSGYSPTFMFSGDLTAFTGTLRLVANQVGNGATTYHDFMNTSTVGTAGAIVMSPNWIAGNNNIAMVRWNPSTTTSATIPIGALSSSFSGDQTPSNAIVQNAKSGTTATFQIGGLNTDTTFGGIIQNGSGTTALTKVGTGMLTLTGPNTYTGLTTVSAGELLVTSAANGKGGYTVGNGGVLGVTNLADGNSLAVSNLTLAAGSGLDFQNLVGGSVPFITASNVILNGSCTVMLSSTSYVAPGVYPLINYAGNFTGSFANLQLQLPAGWSGVLVNNANQVAVNITAVPPPAAPTGLTATPGFAQVNLSWTASPGATSYNVKRALVSGGAYTTIATSVTTTSYANTGLAYGTYYYVVSAVNNSGQSPDSEEASVVLGAPLIWTGNINSTWDLGGTANWKSNGVATVYQDGGPVQFDDSALLTTIANAASVLPSAILVSNLSKNFTFSDPSIDGATAIIKRGSGDLYMNASNSFTGGLTVYAGGVHMEVDSAFGTGPITLQASTYYGSGNIQMNVRGLATWPQDLIVLGTVTNTIQMSANNTSTRLALAGQLIGTNGTTLELSSGYSPTYQFIGDATGFAGTLRFVANQAANSASTYYDFMNPSAVGVPLAAIVMSPNWKTGGYTNLAFLQWNPVTTTSATIPIGSLSSSFASAQPTTNAIVRNAKSGTTATFQIGGLNTDTTFGGTIQNGSGTTALRKVGTGTLTLTGQNSYSGLTAVASGRLLVTADAIGTGAYTVSNNATLGITNISPASIPACGALTLAAGATLEFQNVSSLTAALVKSSGLTVSGAAQVTITGTNFLTIGNTYPLLTNSGAMSGFGNLSLQMPPGWNGTLVSNANQISLSVTAPPLPAVPLNLVATSGNAKVNLSWNSAANATGYNLKRSLTNGGPYVVIAANYSGLTFTNTGLANGTLYYYVVSATNNVGESANSTQASARPVSTIPPQLVVSSGGGQLQLTWPLDHTGWLLQSNSVGLNAPASWFLVPGTDATNVFIVPINPTQPQVCYRLTY